jgi:hypothetical protein
VIKKTLMHCTAATALTAVLSLATAAISSAAPHGGASETPNSAAGFAATSAQPFEDYGYYDYVPGSLAAPGAASAAPYYENAIGADWGWSAFPPGCGAGRPHC